MKSRGLVAAICVCVVALLTPMVATAKKKKPTKYRTVTTSTPVSFSGSCTFNQAGLVFSPGLKIAEVEQTDTLTASGSCGSAGSAKLTGTVKGVANCTGGKEIATGTGTLVVGSTSIPVNLAFKIALPTGVLTVQGMTSGSVSGNAAFANGNNLSGMPGCVGAGLTHATFNVKLTTSGPITSTVTTTKRVPIKAKD